jgi:hypothetical protein
VGWGGVGWGGVERGRVGWGGGETIIVKINKYAYVDKRYQQLTTIYSCSQQSPTEFTTVQYDSTTSDS